MTQPKPIATVNLIFFCLRKNCWSFYFMRSFVLNHFVFYYWNCRYHWKLTKWMSEYPKFITMYCSLLTSNWNNRTYRIYSWTRKLELNGDWFWTKCNWNSEPSLTIKDSNWWNLLPQCHLAYTWHRFAQYTDNTSSNVLKNLTFLKHSSQ